ncbi:unnamed protein product, partial [Prorocentrum cordatum]
SIINAEYFDVTRAPIADAIVQWILCGSIWAVALGTPCTRWSAARRGGEMADSAASASGIACAKFSCRAVRACLDAGAQFVIENPRSSHLWSWPPLESLLRRAAAVRVELDMCAFGAAWKKPTLLVGNLQGLARAEASRGDGAGSLAVEDVFRLALPSSVLPPPGGGAVGCRSEHLAACLGQKVSHFVQVEPLPTEAMLGWESADGHWGGQPLKWELGVLAQRYRDCCAAVARFARAVPAVADVGQSDKLLVEYMEFLFLDGAAVSAARYALYGVAWTLDFPIKPPSCCALAKATLRAFFRRAPEKSRGPPCEEMLWLFVDFFIQHELHLVGFSAVLAWDCYLWPSEAIELRKGDLCPPVTGASIQKRSITVAPSARDRPAKNRQVDTGVVAAWQDRRWMEPLLKSVFERTKPGELLFRGLTLAAVEKAFNQASDHLGYK